MDDPNSVAGKASGTNWAKALAVLVLLLSCSITGIHQSLEEANISAITGAVSFPIAASLLVLAVAQVRRSQRTTAARWRTLLYTGIVLLLLSAGMLTEALITAN